MSTYVLMKILESVPQRYDKGIRFLTAGRLDEVYDHMISLVSPGMRVLDIGCGTGALTIRAAKAGAEVKAIDVNADMLTIARQRAQEEGVDGQIQFTEMGIAELDGEPEEVYDMVTSGLCFSELSESEQVYGLQQIFRILKPGGRLFLVDEVLPQRFWRRWFIRLLRFPLVVLTYLISQSTTRAVRHLPEKISGAGFHIEQCNTYLGETLEEVIARKP